LFIEDKTGGSTRLTHTGLSGGRRYLIQSEDTEDEEEQDPFQEDHTDVTNSVYCISSTGE
jgi:hypothetical protein